MSGCIDCDLGCLEETSDRCIIYSGKDVERFGVFSGKPYDKVIVALMEELRLFVDKDIYLDCVYTGTCDSCDLNVKMPQAVQLIVDKLCTLTSAHIPYKGKRYCIGNTSISQGAIQLLGKGFKYDVQPTSGGSSITYDLNDIIKTLPDTHRVGRINTVISGQVKGGKTIIVDSNKAVMGAAIDSDRFPINVDIDMHVNTPSGDVKLTKRLSIPTPAAGSYVGSMNVRDFGSDSYEEFSLESFNEAMAAQICSNTSELDSLNGIKNTVGQLAAQIQSLTSKVDQMGTVSFSTPSDECGTSSFTGTINDAFEKVSMTKYQGKTGVTPPGK